MAEINLTVSKLDAHYGDFQALFGIDFTVEQGEVVAVIGSNGAGKSTAMKALFGMLDLSQGKVVFNDEDITDLSPQARVGKGMAFVPQTRNVFPTMSVEENLEMGAFVRTDDIGPTLAQVFDLFPVLKEKRRQLAGELSGGQRQQVAVGRALMTQPKVLMLDEPTAGMSRHDTNRTIDILKQIKEGGMTKVIIEHDMHVVFSVADRISVLARGHIIAEGTPDEIKGNPVVQEAYLGGSVE